jgi:hypothetical protein
LWKNIPDTKYHGSLKYEQEHRVAGTELEQEDTVSCAIVMKKKI